MEKDKTEHYKATKALESLKQSLVDQQMQPQNTETLQIAREEREIEEAIRRKEGRQEAFLSFVDERRQEILDSCC
jgi:protein subunit release factor B